MCNLKSHRSCCRVPNRHPAYYARFLQTGFFSVCISFVSFFFLFIPQSASGFPRKLCEQASEVFSLEILVTLAATTLVQTLFCKKTTNVLELRNKVWRKEILVYTRAAQWAIKFSKIFCLLPHENFFSTLYTMYWIYIVYNVPNKHRNAEKLISIRGNKTIPNETTT